jgi:hypothetical protein
MKRLLIHILLLLVMAESFGSRTGYGFIGKYRTEFVNESDRAQLFLDLPNKVWTYSKNNFDADREPLATDDVSGGYRRGVSKWFYLGNMYLLKDETEGAAIWEKSNLEVSDLATVAVSGSTTDLTEGTNLFYTDARARAALSAAGTLSYDNATGVFSNSETYATDAELVTALADEDITWAGVHTFTGNVYVSGTTIQVDSEIVTADTVIAINDGEVGAGVTLGYAGTYIDRGSANPYFFGFDEVRDGFVVGEITELTTAQIAANTQLLATRQDNPTNGYFAKWNDSASRFDTVEIDYSDLTGTPTFSAYTLNSNAAITAGTIDGTVIGGTAVAAIAGTTGTFTENISSGTGATAVNLILNGSVGTSRDYTFQSAGDNRWKIRMNGDAESGTLTGSNLDFIAYTNIGVISSTPLSINRETGLVTVTSLSAGAVTATTYNGLTISGSAGTLTIPTSSSLIRSGGHAMTLTTTGATNVTFPTTGTLVTRTGTSTLTNKTLTSPTITGTGTITAGAITGTTINGVGDMTVSGGDISLTRSTTSGQTKTINLYGARNNSTVDSFADVKFWNYDSDGGANDYVGAKISAWNNSLGNTGGTDHGSLRFYTSDGSTLIEALSIWSDQRAVFNGNLEAQAISAISASFSSTVTLTGSGTASNLYLATSINAVPTNGSPYANPFIATGSGGDYQNGDLVIGSRLSAGNRSIYLYGSTDGASTTSMLSLHPTNGATFSNDVLLNNSEYKTLIFNRANSGLNDNAVKAILWQANGTDLVRERVISVGAGENTGQYELAINNAGAGLVTVMTVNSTGALDLVNNLTVGSATVGTIGIGSGSAAATNVIRAKSTRTGSNEPLLELVGNNNSSIIIQVAKTGTMGVALTIDQDKLVTFQGAIQANSSLVVGSPTGGDKGTGTINAVAVYDDNVLLTDYVFEAEYLGKALDKQHENYSRKSFTDELAFVKEHYHLSTIIGRKEWEAKGSASVGQLASQLWQSLETQFIYLAEANERINKLESKINLLTNKLS